MARTVNPRGSGAALREEILDATARLLAATTSGDGVGLRAIAREAGVAAPSIYPHFRDRDAILDAVVARTFETLRDASAAAAARHRSPARRVRAVCRAYLDFAAEHPGEYRILFERGAGDVTGHEYPAGREAFDVLVEALGSLTPRLPRGSGPERTAQILWAALHGFASLPAATPGFPWEPVDVLLDRLLAALLGPASPARRASRG